MINTAVFLGGTHRDADFSKPQLFGVVYFGVQAHEDMLPPNILAFNIT